MISSQDPKSNAILTVLQTQRDAALEQVALLAGDLAAANIKIAELEPLFGQLAEANAKIAELTKE